MAEIEIATKEEYRECRRYAFAIPNYRRDCRSKWDFVIINTNTPVLIYKYNPGSLQLALVSVTEQSEERVMQWRFSWIADFLYNIPELNTYADAKANGMSRLYIVILPSHSGI